MVELLAPAGSREALIAAIESGANAVYLAGSRFGARANADNFDEEGLKEAVLLAHLRGVAVHVTVNTIVDDAELPLVADYLRFLYAAGVDAVLVQDLGVARLARQVVPSLPLHASTQMTVHNLAGVQALEKMGFRRVVLSREMSLQDIRYICAHSRVEIEVFAHGALCICYSGQCLMSSMIGGRSGNRGRCAQPCRLPYTLVDRSGTDLLEDTAGHYLLSPRDLNTIGLLPELLAAGVASLKIEGRMKRPEYVGIVTDVYRRAIDAAVSDEGYSVSEEDRRRLAQIFNRDFTTAYLEKQPGREMMSDRRPNNRGLLIGRVLQYDDSRRRVWVKLSDALHEGDEVDFWVKVGGRVTATIHDIEDRRAAKLTAAAAGDEVSFPLASFVREHDRVFRVFDARLMETARALFHSGAPVRRIPIHVNVRAAVGEPFRIMLTSADGFSAEAASAFIGEAAKKRPLTREMIQKQLSRLGTTVYSLENLEISLVGEVMVPVSEINETRRRAVELLDARRLEPYERPAAPAAVPLQRPPEMPAEPRAQLIASVDTVAKAKAALQAGADGVLFGGESYSHEVLTTAAYHEVWQLARQMGRSIYFNTPRIIRDNAMKAFMQLMEDFRAFTPDEVYVHNIASLFLLREQTPFSLHTDFSLIAYNHLTLSALKDLGVQSATLSPELNFSQIEALAAHRPLPLECIVHGRLELMVSDYCVAGSFLGDAGSGHCSQPCRQRAAEYALKDRKEECFPLVMDQFCHMHVLNAKTLSLLPHAMRFAPLGISRLRIEGKAMDADALRRMISAYREFMNLSADLTPEQKERSQVIEGKDITRGHYFRGVL